jgi:uncharacterized protein (DUF362 family)/Pyruvate/2-oxoacid:ferredoxin oxidoreductase delta subunit
MPRVFVRKAAYDQASLGSSVSELLEASSARGLLRNRRVLIKPNLLGPARPERAMITHPLIIKAVTEYVLDHGGTVQISDSPAMGSLEKVLRESGISEALRGLDVACREFKDSVMVDLGEPFNKVEIARDVTEADVVINLPKLKTHSQMLLTLGVKNLFGCIVGLRKPQWHLRSGIDREVFATLLVRICRAIHPSITLLDGILAMEGEGPGRSGWPRPLGVILASDSPPAIDVAVCRMLKLDEDELLTTRVAKREGYLSGPVEVTGDAVAVEGFALPTMTPLVFGPPWAHGFLRRHFIQRPEVEPELCKLCGECWRYCPAHAISVRSKQLSFDCDKCIRCYCCIEVCPHGALKTCQPMLGRLTAKAMKRSF